jgi:hypothetical protein
MTSDADWVEEVRRWFLGGRRRADTLRAAEPAADEGDALGYEAACPPLQASGWPDAPLPNGVAPQP